MLGRSDIVGSPVVAMLRKLDATVTQCHSRSRDLPFIVSPRCHFSNHLSHMLSVHQLQHADIVVSAIGKPEFVKGEWIKPGAVVVDVGTNYIPGMYPYHVILVLTLRPDATKKSGQRLVGDVEFASASTVASWITPVPGGVGPMTVAMLISNTLKSAERLREETRWKKVRPLPLNILEKVPR